MLTTDTDLPPLTKIKKARVSVIRRDPFFGAIAARLIVKELTQPQAQRLKTSTLATDGKYLYFYAPGVAKEPFKKFITIMAHEGAHVAFKHPLRRGSRNFRLWVRACDIVVNNILRRAGYEMPDHGTYRHDLDGMSAEKVYAILLKEREDQRKQRRQQIAQMQQQLEDQRGDMTQGGDEPGDDGDDFQDDDDELDSEWWDDEENDEQDQDDESDDQDERDEQDDRFEVESADDWEREFDQDTQPDAEGAFQIDPDLLEDESTLDDLPKLPDLPDELSSDGMLLDAPDDLKATEGEQQLDLTIEAAFNGAKSAGLMPGGVEVLVESQRKHKIDYRDLMRDWLDQNLFPGDYSWKRPNRRYLQHNIILPGLINEENLPNVAFVCDTSISVNDQELRVYSREISGVLEEFPCDFDVVFCDTDVRHTQHFETDDLPITLEAYGRGGTKFVPAFEYIRANYPDVDAIMYFTDMGAWDWEELKEHDPGLPVLWMNTDRTEDNFNPPFGTVIPLEIEPED